jgi:hypothetical protein
MPGDRTLRTEEDLQRVVRTLAREFKTDTVFIIGSQAILMSWPDAPGAIRGSPEIDAYPANAKMWEIAESTKRDGIPREASEHILPGGWNARAIVRRLDVDGRMVKAVAPAPEDLIVSKLARLDDKDKTFVEAYHNARPLDIALIARRIAATDLDPAVAARAISYLRSLAGTGSA